MFESILIMKNQKYRNMQNRNFSAGPVVKTSPRENSTTHISRR